MQTNNLYDYASFTIATATTDYDVKTNETDLWSNINVAGMCRLTFNKAISIKFNVTTLPAVDFAATESGVKIGNSHVFDIPIAYISNLYITNTSGDTVTM